MQAVVYDDYGDASVLHCDQIAVPKRTSGEVLIEVHATSVNPIDYRIRSGELKGLLPGGFPRVPGYDVAGVVVDCEDGDPFDPGDRVMAFLRHVRGGACAEFSTCPIDAVAKLPAVDEYGSRRRDSPGGNHRAAVLTRPGRNAGGRTRFGQRCQRWLGNVRSANRQGVAKPKATDLQELIRLHESGQLSVTIDSRFDFAQAADAHRRIESGVDHGKVVIAIKPSQA